MKLLPDLYIDHPETSGEPVSLRRWLWWQWAELLYRLLQMISTHHHRAECRAFNWAMPDDEIPF